jgi:drug/metabolite transporter (DMT)-like permease
MLFGGLLLLVVGVSVGEKLSSFRQSTSTSWMALLYLAIFGSIVGYSAFVWLVANAPISLTATYTYVNPVIAVFLGAVFLKEKFHVSELIGGCVVLIGVILVVKAEGKQSARKVDV